MSALAGSLRVDSPILSIRQTVFLPGTNEIGLETLSPAKPTFGSGHALPDKPELLAAALAHVVRLENNREVLLGQAWIAGPGQLVTCGHVVEPYINNPSSVVVKFPASGNRYAVKSIKLHPSFVRQPDQLVKFDAALLNVVMSEPELNEKPLKISFERPLKPNQAVATVRYPVHLGQLSAAPQPLAQEGKYLGQLRKHDSFHLLHDLALSPGDSGAPIFDGELVVGLHCGDTATLPGLNLPMTSIRLALWVDALRDLDLAETAGTLLSGRWKAYLSALVAFLFTAALAATFVCLSSYPDTRKAWGLEQPLILPVDVSFNKPLDGYQMGDPVQMVVIPRSDCWLYLFDVDAKDQVLALYPPHGLPAFVKAGQSRTIDRFGGRLIRVNDAQDKLHLVALNSDFPLVTRSDWAQDDPAGQPLYISGDELAERIEHFMRADSKNVIHLVMDAPRAH